MILFASILTVGIGFSCIETAAQGAKVTPILGALLCVGGMIGGLVWLGVAGIFNLLLLVGVFSFIGLLLHKFDNPYRPGGRR